MRGLVVLPSTTTHYQPSVGHVILDSLAARFNVPFRADRALRGFVARTRMPVSDGEVDLTLYKPSTWLYLLDSLLFI